jgi:Zn finger protein HypA/HybF involved in hydrogenase expression
MTLIEIIKITCLRCGHSWIPRKTDIRLCPRCKTVNWDVPPSPLSEGQSVEGQPENEEKKEETK